MQFSFSMFHVCCAFLNFYVAFKDCCLVLLVVFGFLWCVLIDTGQNQRQYWMYNSSGDYSSIFYSLPVIKFFLVIIKRSKLQTNTRYEQIHTEIIIFSKQGIICNSLLQNTNVQLRNKTLNISRLQISLIFKCCKYSFYSIISQMLLLTRSVLLQNFFGADKFPKLLLRCVL